MKALSLYVVFILLIPSTSFSGDDVNNGGGLSEQRITHAYLQIKKYIDLCLNINECNINKKEKSVLELIKAQLKDEYKNKTQLQFLSEKKNPGTFIINGEIKVAKTGDAIGSPILFNLDLLYSKSKKAITLPRAISILVHELGHHNNTHIDPNDSHTFLDLLGNKVALLYSDLALTTPLTAAHREIQIQVLNQNHNKDSFPEVLLRVNHKMINLSEQLKKNIKCTKMILPLGVQIKGAPPKGIKVHNLHWTKIKEKNKSWNFTVVGNLSNFCGDKDKLIHLIKKFKIAIKFKAKKTIKNNKVYLSLKESSIKVHQIYDPWIKFFDIPII